MTKNSQIKDLNNPKDLNHESDLSPNWITGFSDAEGCFSVILSKRSPLKWRIVVSFEINLHSKDIMILHKIPPGSALRSALSLSLSLSRLA